MGRHLEVPRERPSQLGRRGVVMVVAALVASAAWAGAGGLLSRIVADPRLHRAVALAMAALLVATVATVWL